MPIAWLLITVCRRRWRDSYMCKDRHWRIYIGLVWMALGFNLELYGRIYGRIYRIIDCDLVSWKNPYPSHGQAHYINESLEHVVRAEEAVFIVLV